MIKKTILNNVSENVNKILNNIETYFFNEIEEIRIRTNKPIIIKANRQEYYVTDKGLVMNSKLGYVCTNEDVKKSLHIMSNRSMYTIQEDLKRGFLTLQGGHRVGITGQTVLAKNEIVTIKNINGLNIRICREIKGCSNKVFKNINVGFGHTLIISPPACGKTTLLRDLIRNLSNAGYAVGVVDERNEISASHKGEYTIDLGIRTDVLVNCPKVIGMTMLLRSMSPQIIAVDEIGTAEDMQSIEMLLNAGIKILATIHSNDIDELKNKKGIEKLVKNKVFDNYIVLSNKNKVGEVVAMYDKNLQLIRKE